MTSCLFPGSSAELNAANVSSIVGIDVQCKTTIRGVIVGSLGSRPYLSLRYCNDNCRLVSSNTIGLLIAPGIVENVAVSLSDVAVSVQPANKKTVIAAINCKRVFVTIFTCQ